MIIMKKMKIDWVKAGKIPYNDEDFGLLATGS